MPEFLLGFIESRRIGVVHIVDSRLGFDLLPDIAVLAEPPVVVARMPAPKGGEIGKQNYVSRRYGNLVDAFWPTPSRVPRLAHPEHPGQPHRGHPRRRP